MAQALNVESNYGAGPNAQGNYGADPYAQGNYGAAPQPTVAYASPTFNWNTVQASQIQAFRDLAPDEAEKKMESVRAGGELSQQYPPLPDSRRCNDVIFAILFLLTVGAAAAVAVINRDVGLLGLRADFWPAAGAATACALVVAIIWAFMMSRSAACVVWTSLVFPPVVFILLGMWMIAQGNSGFVGPVMVAAGACQLCCIFTCLRRCIDFTIEVVAVIGKVILENKSVLVVSLIGGAVGFMWPLICLVGLLGTANLDGDGDENYPVVVGWVFVFFWGVLTAGYFFHTILCGVFGRWYYGHKNGFVGASLKVACTTSFGSICLASLIVAVLKTLVVMMRVAESNAQEEGNEVLRIALMCLRCIVNCIADIVDYLNEWALVQVAIRGASFMNAAKITWTMLTMSSTSNILQDILIDSVAGFGVLLCAAASCLVPVLTQVLIQGQANFPLEQMSFGFFVGLLVGASTMGIIGSGAKTILASWSVNPEFLEKKDEHIYRRFQEKTQF